MSELRKAIVRPAGVPVLPDPPPLLEEDGEEDSSSTSSMSSAGTLVPREERRKSTMSAATWSDYFDQELYLHDPTRHAKYHVYITPPRDVVKDPLYICHHGAGSSGLSFALFCKEVRQKTPSAGVMSVEARNHGSSVSDADGQTSHDYSLDALSDDLLAMIHSTQKRLVWKQLPNIVLLGHSLGGAVVTRLARTGSLGAKLVGYGVIDVVEGSAMDALKSMKTYLASRPSSFGSIEEAIDWHIRSRTIRNPVSARVATPPLLRETSSGKWTWSTDLISTQKYWEDWFAGMSANFLGGRAAKILLLAGTDRLDRELMIGQMQGKFQLQVFPEAGHFVQEDVPQAVADVMVEFYRRNDRSALVLPPKVSDLLAQGKKV